MSPAESEARNASNPRNLTWVIPAEESAKMAPMPPYADLPWSHGGFFYLLPFPFREGARG
jgi:hypothetical protein